MRQKNDDNDVSTWTCECIKKVLKSHGSVQEGNQDKIHSRCLLLKKLIYYGLENVMSMSKTTLRSMSADLTLPFGADISKDDLILNMHNVMIHNHNDTIEQMLTLVEEGYGCEEVV